MARYLITGRGGTGKSTICQALRAQGLTAFDTDKLPGLARGEDMHGAPTQIDWNGFVDYSKVQYNWQPLLLEQFLRDHPDVFLCGSASNQLQFHQLFDKVFVLIMPRGEHEQRLQHRSSPYGKNVAMRAYLLDMQEQFVQEAIQGGAIPVDASGDVAQTVAAIRSLAE